MPDKKSLAEQFNINKFYKPNKDHTNRWVWRKLPTRLFKKKRGKRMTKKLSPAEEYELNFLRKQVDHYETKVFELERHKDIARDHERAREELKSYVLKLRGLGREI